MEISQQAFHSSALSECDCSIAFCEALKRLLGVPLLVRSTLASQPRAVRPPPVEWAGTALVIIQINSFS